MARFDLARRCKLLRIVAVLLLDGCGVEFVCLPSCMPLRVCASFFGGSNIVRLVVVVNASLRRRGRP